MGGSPNRTVGNSICNGHVVEDMKAEVNGGDPHSHKSKMWSINIDSNLWLDMEMEWNFGYVVFVG